MDTFDEVLEHWKKLTIGGLLAMGMLMAQPVVGDSVEDYQVFVTRNPFNLKDPPPKPEPVAAVKVPDAPGDLKLTGITKMRGRNRVMMVNTPPGEDPMYLSIMEGNRREGIEVLEGGVDISKGTVRVKIDGEEKTLSFDTDGLEGAAPVAKKATPRLGNPSNKYLKNASRIRIPSPKPKIGGSSSSSSPKNSGFPQRSMRTSSRPSSKKSIITSTVRSRIPAPGSTTANQVRLNVGPATGPVNPPKYENVLPPAQQRVQMEVNAEMEKMNPNVVEIRPGEFITVEAPPIPR